MKISTGVFWLALAASPASAGSKPELAGKVDANATAAGPALEAQGCEVLRAWFVRRPTLADAVTMAAPCVRSFLKARGASVEVRGALRDGVELIVLVVDGPREAEEAIERALDAEQGQLLGFPAKITYPVKVRW